MCKHILNAQVSIRAPCCKKWFDCPECHAENITDHPLAKTTEMVFACKKCKKVFRKDLAMFEESDEFCPHCDNHFVIDAETKETKAIREGKAQMVVGLEMEAGADMTRDQMRKHMMSKMIEDDSLHA